MLKSLSQRAATAFTSLFVACILVFAYRILFEATRPSPLADANLQDWLAVLGISVGTATSVAAILTIACLPFQLHPLVGRVVTICLTWLILAIGSIVALENFSYTLFATGLKTEQATSLKSIFLIGSALLAALLTRPCLGAGKLKHRNYLVVGAVATACIYYAPSLLSALRTGVAVTQTRALPNIVILSADGLNAEWLSAYGASEPTTPFLSSRAEEFALFENAFTPTGNTTGSITALLTGQSPFKTGVVYPPQIMPADKAARSLPAMLGGLGYYRSNWAVPVYADALSQNLVGAFDMNNGLSIKDQWSRYIPGGSGLDRWFANQTAGDLQALALDVLSLKEAENPYSQITEDSPSRLSDADRLAGVLG